MGFIEDSWVAHAKGKYPREFASPNRMHNPVMDDETFIKLIKAYGPAHNDFCSVYSFDKWERVKKKNRDILVYENAVIDCIFIDLDCDRLPYAHYEAKMLDMYLHHYKCDPRQCFTGNKGFAVYIDFPEVKLNKELVKPILRKYLESIQNVLSLKSIDRVCFDSISRISRIPNTLNHKSGLYCIPLSRKELWGPLSEIKEKAKRPSKTPVIVNECDRIPGVLLSIEQDLLNQKEITQMPLPACSTRAQTGRGSDNKTEPTSLCPGIVHIMDGVSEGGRDNSLCAMICALNLQTRKSKDEIFPIAQYWIELCSPPIEMDNYELSNKIDYLVDNEFRPCTFAMRTGNKMCQKCPVAKR